jgi:L-asparagine transporter-like permease
MRYWFPGAPGWWWILGFSALLVAVNAFSVRLFGAVEYFFSAIKIAAIAAFLLLGAWILFGARAAGMGFANYTADGGFFPHGLTGAWVAVIVAIFSYFSIEMVAVAAGEAQEPERAIVSAFRATFFRLAFFYLATIALMLALVPWRQAGSGGSPFVMVMAATGVPGAAGLINFVILIAALSAMNSQLYAASRMLFSLARAKQAPRAFGVADARGVPLAALALSTVGMAIAGIVYALAPERAFATMIAVSSFGAMFTWGMIFVTHLAFRRARPDGAGFRMWGHPYTSLLGAGLIAAVMITTLFTEAFRLTLLYGIPATAALCLAYALGPRARRSGSAG